VDPLLSHDDVMSVSVCERMTMVCG
jgi:hypothetical protein